MDTELKTAIDEAVTPVMEAFEAFKAANDERNAEIAKFGEASDATETKLAAIQKTLDSYEDINAKLTAAEAEAKVAKEEAEELKTRTDDLEKRLNRPNAGGTAEERKEALHERANTWAHAVFGAITKGIPNLSEEHRMAIEGARDEYKSLSVTDDTSGGYLAPVEFVREIIKAITEISPARQVARIRTTSSKAIQVPKRTGQFAALRVAEQGTRAETTGLAWGMIEIPAPTMYALIDISEENLEDSAFNLEAEIRMEAEEQFALLEGTEFVSGTGVGEMEGVLTNADVANTNTEAATTVTADSLISVKHAIKTGYSRNGTFLLNRTTLGSVRKLKDGMGQYLWQPGIALGKPNSIDGDPYWEFPDMPLEGAGLKPVIYGDFKRAYTILDRIGMVLLRDPLTQATSGNIRFLFRRRSGGRVVLAEAIRTLTCAVT